MYSHIPSKLTWGELLYNHALAVVINDGGTFFIIIVPNLVCMYPGVTHDVYSMLASALAKPERSNRSSGLIRNSYDYR
jgi:hypothetical protein